MISAGGSPCNCSTLARSGEAGISLRSPAWRGDRFPKPIKRAAPQVVALGELGAQDAQRQLRAGAIGNGQVFNVDRKFAYQASLRRIEGQPSLFGAKSEQPGWLRRSFRERLRLGFDLDSAGHLPPSCISVTN